MASVNDKLTRSTVALFHHKEIVGTGFFIGNDGSFLTCSHVVKGERAIEIPDNELIATFNGKDYPVEYLYIYPDLEVLDAAVLRLTEKKLPPEAILLPLGEWELVSQQRHRFRTFGFRTPDYFHGLHAAGEIRGYVKVMVSGARLLQLEPEETDAQEIRPGMSGAPVYDEDSEQIIGMITSFFKQEKQETIPLALPIEEIAKIWHPVKARLVEEELLLQFSKILRIGEWFTEKTLKSFYESLPIPHLKRYDELRDDKPQAVLDQLRGRELTYDFINYIRTKRPDIPLVELIAIPPLHRINFVNREDELKEARGRYAVSYILYEAPMGYGKTELLKAIKQQHLQDGWVCIDVEISKDINTVIDLVSLVVVGAGYSYLLPLPDIKTAGHVLGAVLKERVSSFGTSGVILLIDNVERLPESEIDAFLNCFLMTIRQKVNLRVRFAGCYIGSLWKKQAKEFELIVRPLTPFRFRYVKDTVLSLLPSHQYPDLCAAHLMHVTGGHPGCMAKIIESMDFDQSVEEHFKTHQEKYKELILPVVREIWGSIPESLQNIFDVLSVFRRYNYRLLQKIIDMGLIKYEPGADSLEKVLTATYLVKRKDGFIQDEIVRRLLAIRLRWEKPDRFIEVCEKARQIYEEDLQSTHSRRPELIALEGLYQELQLSYYQSEQTFEARQNLRAMFFADDGILHKYVKILSNKPNVLDIEADFMALLEEEVDWEFRFALNFYLRGESQYNNEPYKQMLSQIRTFFAQKMGGEHG